MKLQKPDPSPISSEAPGTMSRTSLAIAAFSTVVEWYDFTLFLYMATILSRLFFGGGGSGLMMTLGGFAVAYLMRPIGAIVFGHLGDRFGRRPAMLIAMGLMTAAMLVTAVLPTGGGAGSGAGLLLLLLRCVMGFSVGGEYTGVVAYLLEGAHPKRRGLITSLAAAASEVGALLAAGVCALTLAVLTDAEVDAWGWRLPFVFGGVLAASILLARLRIEESPDFRRQMIDGTVPKQPLLYALRHHRIGILRGFAISALGSITYYVGITYVPVFLTSTGGMSEARSLQLATIAALVVIVVTPFFGMLSDRFGRKPILLALALCSAALPMLVFSLLTGSSWNLALVAAMVMAAVAGGVSAVGAVTTAEQFPGEGRLSGLAFGATTATAVFGGLTPYVAQVLIAQTGWQPVPGAMIAAVAILALPVLVSLPETGPSNRLRSR